MSRQGLKSITLNAERTLSLHINIFYNSSSDNGQWTFLHSIVLPIVLRAVGKLQIFPNTHSCPQNDLVHIIYYTCLCYHLPANLEHTSALAIQLGKVFRRRRNDCYRTVSTYPSRETVRTSAQVGREGGVTVPSAQLLLYRHSALLTHRSRSHPSATPPPRVRVPTGCPRISQQQGSLAFKKPHSTQPLLSN